MAAKKKKKRSASEVRRIAKIRASKLIGDEGRSLRHEKGRKKILGLFTDFPRLNPRVGQKRLGERQRRLQGFVGRGAIQGVKIPSSAVSASGERKLTKKKGKWHIPGSGALVRTVRRKTH